MENVKKWSEIAAIVALSAAMWNIQVQSDRCRRLKNIYLYITDTVYRMGSFKIWRSLANSIEQSRAASRTSDTFSYILKVSLESGVC
jgi:hypothetical protein